MNKSAAAPTIETPTHETGHLDLPIPEPVLRVLTRLAKGGSPCWVVGECLHEILAGERPRVFQARTLVPGPEILNRFPQAVPTAPMQRRIMVPTPAGPLDLSSARDERELESELRNRTFSIHAMAYEPNTQQLVDPVGGLKDTRRGHLRATAKPSRRFAAAPLEALRGAILLARFAYTADTSLETGFRIAAARTRAIRRTDLRRALTTLLEQSLPGPGIAMLHCAGFEAALFGPTREEAPEIVDFLPPQVPLRLAAWLLDTDAQKYLQRLGFPPDLTSRVQRLLRHHPIDGSHAPGTHTRLSPEERNDLFELRRAEILHGGKGNNEAAEVKRQLAALESSLANMDSAVEHEEIRKGLALNGTQVMSFLACRPGPTVGKALAFLADHVAQHPESNTASQLRKRLQEWSETHST